MSQSQPPTRRLTGDARTRLAVGAVVAAQRMGMAHPLMMLGTTPMSTLTGKGV
tara:strand:- start:557 stop:715 length:159 start_codon:yes stop_codon:yes gene_type:complete